MARTKAAPLTAAEYFAGIGLFRVGLEQAGWQTLWANDCCPRKKKVYQGFFGKPDLWGKDRGRCRQVWGDIAAVRGADVPTTTLATCSFPCTDLSVAGKQAGLRAGTQSSAFFQFIRILQEQGRRRPRVVLLENVPGLLTNNGGRDFEAVCFALAGLGYATDAFILDARHFVPQSRRRLFIVAASPTAFGEQTPEQSKEILASRPAALLTPPLTATLKEAAAGMPGHCLLRLPAPPAKMKAGFSALLEPLPPTDKRWWGHDRVNHHLQLMPASHASRLYASPVAFCHHGKQKKGAGSKVKLSPCDISACLLNSGAQPRGVAFYQRGRGGKGAKGTTEVRGDDLSGCLLSAGGKPQGVAFVGIQTGQRRGKMTEVLQKDCAVALGKTQARHVNIAAITPAGVRMRALTAREAGRLMGLPDSYKITKAITERQIVGYFGDAVACPAVKWAATHAARALLANI